MANYKEEVAEGAAWRRCKQVDIVNAYGFQPFIRFYEEDIVTVAGRTGRVDGGFMTQMFDPGTAIPLLDPETGLPTGESTTHAAIYQALYSAYIAQAVDRDMADSEMAAAFAAASAIPPATPTE